VRQNETSQTQRVVGRSPEQPSPKCCSPKNLLLEFQHVNGTDGPVEVSLFGMHARGVQCGPPAIGRASVRHVTQVTNQRDGYHSPLPTHH